MNQFEITFKKLQEPRIDESYEDSGDEDDFESLDDGLLNKFDDDIYDEVNDLLAKESQKFGTDDYDEAFYSALEEIHNVMQESGVHRDWRYAQAEKMLTDAKMEHEKWLVDQVVKNAGKPADAGSNE